MKSTNSHLFEQSKTSMISKKTMSFTNGGGVRTDSKSDSNQTQPGGGGAPTVDCHIAGGLMRDP
jgi:hypothetical protein